MKKRSILWAFVLSLFTLVSCSKDEINKTNGDPVAVKFTSTINGTVTTKAAGATWSTFDKIGVFMKKNNLPLEDANILNSASNKHYETISGNGDFTPVSGHTIYYPNDGSKVDFVAYYPYTGTISNYIYNVDVANQTSQENIDLLYSASAKGLDKTTPNATLVFEHQLSKLVFNVSAGTGVSSLSGLTVKISGMKTKASFNLSTAVINVDNASTADIMAKVTSSGTSAVVEAIVLPVADAAGYTVTFDLPSAGSFKWTVPASTKYDKATKYSYNVELKNTSGNTAIALKGNIADWTSGSSESLILDNGGTVDANDGSEAKPYTVTEAFGKAGETAKWVTGYVVGVTTATKSTFTSKANILIAATAGETDNAKQFVIDLSENADLQARLNLVDHEVLLGQVVKVKGDVVASVYGMKGLINITAQVGGIEPVPPITDPVIFYNETFGTVDVSSAKPKIEAYTGWDMKAPVVYTDISPNYPTEYCDIRVTSTTTNHIWVPANKNTGIKISGIESGYKNIKLSYDIATNKAGENANVIAVKCNGTGLTNIPSIVFDKTNTFATITVDVPDNTTMLEFVASAATNVGGYRIDNIKLEGVK